MKSYGFALEINVNPRLDFWGNFKRRCKSNFSGASSEVFGEFQKMSNIAINMFNSNSPSSYFICVV